MGSDFESVLARQHHVEHDGVAAFFLAEQPVERCLAVAYIPYDEDSYGYVTLEACLAKKAVITCTDSGGIDALVRHRVARTSRAPGKTRLANIYRVTRGATGPFYLVDLPGYGYARGGMPVAFVERVHAYYDILLAHQPSLRPRLRMFSASTNPPPARVDEPTLGKK